jgi:hypothetical protein
MQKWRIVTLGISGERDRSHGRYATPADSLLHDITPCRRWGLRFVHHSRAILCRAVRNLAL